MRRIRLPVHVGVDDRSENSLRLIYRDLGSDSAIRIQFGTSKSQKPTVLHPQESGICAQLMLRNSGSRKWCLVEVNNTMSLEAGNNFVKE